MRFCVSMRNTPGSVGGKGAVATAGCWIDGRGWKRAFDVLRIVKLREKKQSMVGKKSWLIRRLKLSGDR